MSKRKFLALQDDYLENNILIEGRQVEDNADYKMYYSPEAVLDYIDRRNYTQCGRQNEGVLLQKIIDSRARIKQAYATIRLVQGVLPTDARVRLDDALRDYVNRRTMKINHYHQLAVNMKHVREDLERQLMHW